DFRQVPGGFVSVGEKILRALYFPNVCPVDGGSPLVFVGRTPVVSAKAIGKGGLWVSSLGDQWSDAGLGISNSLPTPAQLALTELEYQAIDFFTDSQGLTRAQSRRA